MHSITKCSISGPASYLNDSFPLIPISTLRFEEKKTETERGGEGRQDSSNLYLSIWNVNWESRVSGLSHTMYITYLYCTSDILVSFRDNKRFWKLGLFKLP